MLKTSANHSNTTKINLTSSEIVINNLRIHDNRIIEFLLQVKPEEQESIIKKALDIGFRVLIDQFSIDRIDYVDKSFHSFSAEIEKRLTDVQETFNLYFGPEGSLTKLCDEENPSGLPAKVTHSVMDEKSGLRAYLDPRNEISPLYRLREELSQQIQTINDLIVGERKSTEMYEKTALKGVDFEKELLDIFESISSHYGDHVEHVGAEATARGRMVGDILIGVRDPLLGNQELLIVVEVKDRADVTVEGKTGLLTELGEAITNREADFAVAIVKKRSALPEKTGHFRFYEPNMIICSGEDPLTIELAYRFGRSVALVHYLQSYKKIDWENVQNFVNSLNTSLKRIETVRGDLNKVQNSIKTINETLKDYRDEIKEDINTMLETIEVTEEN